MAVWQAKAPVAQVFLADVIATGASISMNQCIEDYNKLVPAVGNLTLPMRSKRFDSALISSSFI